MDVAILAPRPRAADLPVAREAERALRQVAALALHFLLLDDAEGDAQDAHGRAFEETVSFADLALAAIIERPEQRVFACAQPARRLLLLRAVQLLGRRVPPRRALARPKKP